MRAKITGPSHRLSIFIGESAHYQHQPLYHAILLAARRMGLAGATVIRAIEGFGPSSRIRSANVLDLSADLPVVIEIVDSEASIHRFLSVLDEMLDHGLVTVEPVQVIQYGSHRKTPTDPLT
jgi:PII-like signaling protein